MKHPETDRNLLLVSRCPPWPLHLGDRLIVWHLAKQLAARGWRIDLLAFTQEASDHDAEQQRAYRELFREVTLHPETPRTPYQVLRRVLWPPLRFPGSAQAAWSPAMWRAIRGLVSAQSYDAIHLFGGIHVYEFANALPEAARAVITPYESYTLYLQRMAALGGWSARLQARFAAQVERWMFTPYGQTVVLAHPDREALRRLNPRLPLSVIPNGVDVPERIATATEREAQTLLFVGNYDYKPNEDAALLLLREIFPKVRERNPQASLWLVGNGPSAAMHAAATSGVEITGRVASIQPYYERATLFVCPLRYGAGMKNKVLEALAYGTPLIATPLSVDGIAVQDEQEARIVPVAAFAATITALLANPPRRDTLAQAGQRVVQQHYSWAAVADRYEQLYTHLAPQFP